MNLNTLIIYIGVLALIFLMCNFYISIKIRNYLTCYGISTNMAMFHVKIFDNAWKYKKLTTQNEGIVGKYYRPFIITFCFFAVFLFTGIVLASL